MDGKLSNTPVPQSALTSPGVLTVARDEPIVAVTPGASSLDPCGFDAAGVAHVNLPPWSGSPSTGLGRAPTAPQWHAPGASSLTSSSAIAANFLPVTREGGSRALKLVAGLAQVACEALAKDQTVGSPYIEILDPANGNPRFRLIYGPDLTALWNRFGGRPKARAKRRSKRSQETAMNTCARALRRAAEADQVIATSLGNANNPRRSYQFKSRDLLSSLAGACRAHARTRGLDVRYLLEPIAHDERQTLIDSEPSQRESMDTTTTPLPALPSLWDAMPSAATSRAAVIGTRAPEVDAKRAVLAFFAHLVMDDSPFLLRSGDDTGNPVISIPRTWTGAMEELWSNFLGCDRLGSRATDRADRGMPSLNESLCWALAEGSALTFLPGSPREMPAFQFMDAAMLTGFALMYHEYGTDASAPTDAFGAFGAPDAAGARPRSAGYPQAAWVASDAVTSAAGMAAWSVPQALPIAGPIRSTLRTFEGEIANFTCPTWLPTAAYTELRRLANGGMTREECVRGIEELRIHHGFDTCPHSSASDIAAHIVRKKPYGGLIRDIVSKIPGARSGPNAATMRLLATLLLINDVSRVFLLDSVPPLGVPQLR